MAQGLPFSTEEEKTRYAVELRASLGVKPFIDSSVIIPPWVVMGQRVTIHAGCTIGCDGFFLARDDDRMLRRIPHTGRVVIEDDVEIFPHAVIDRGLVGDTVIKKGAHIGHKALIAHDAVIGEGAIILISVTVCGYVNVEAGAAVGAGATILEHCRIGAGAFVGAGALVRSDVEPYTVVAGCPAVRLLGSTPPQSRI